MGKTKKGVKFNDNDYLWSLTTHSDLFFCFHQNDCRRSSMKNQTSEKMGSEIQPFGRSQRQVPLGAPMFALSLSLTLSLSLSLSHSFSLSEHLQLGQTILYYSTVHAAPPWAEDHVLMSKRPLRGASGGEWLQDLRTRRRRTSRRLQAQEAIPLSHNGRRR